MCGRTDLSAARVADYLASHNTGKLTLYAYKVKKKMLQRTKVIFLDKFWGFLYNMTCDFCCTLQHCKSVFVSKNSSFFPSRSCFSLQERFMNYRTRLFSLFTLLIFLTALFAGPMDVEAKSRKTKAKAKENDKYAAIVVDARTGTVLHQDNAGQKRHPASLTKMMTLLMLFDAIKRGQVSLNDDIVMSSHAASMPPSKLGIKPGKTIKVEDAILALVTKSANDVAVAVGEHLAQTESGFAKAMTRKARALGMSQTTFKNASGLHNPEQVSSARDMARLALVLLTDYKPYYHYFGTKNFKFRGANYHNHNRLMNTYDGMDGLKTGYIVPSGFNLVASAKRDGNRIVGVVFGGKTASSRNARMKVLLDEGFAKLQTSTQQVADAAPPAWDTPKDAELKAPVPAKKPTGFDLAATGVEDMSLSRSAGSRWAMLEDTAMLSRMSGQGDYDNDVRARVKAGLISISAHTHKPIPARIWSKEYDSDLASAPSAPEYEKTSYTPQNMSPDWAIQIGAFTSRDRTDKAIAEALKKLPRNLRSANPIIAPVQTPQGWIFRARLSGYTKVGASEACGVLPDCIPIAPYAQ